uniref:Scaffolding anchor of CK1 domain-containing protein n=1 Tax=Mola mola TaxID=94237 RepID=A0A3Q3X5P5_MOLML
MALSQLLDDSPLRPGPGQSWADDLYNERHRLALEELLSEGIDTFLDFLKREGLPNFLSDDEIQRITRAAVAPRCAPLHVDDQALEQSAGGTSADCSSVTYFPEVSDVEPPLLEIGWPAFTAGSYRGVTRAVAHFQPGYGDSIYCCKEAARRMIKSAKEVIAIVTDSLTDLDIFKDLQEACTNGRVPVYILLDQSCAPSFLKMCANIGVCPESLQQMRVRTIAGTTYYMRSGATVTGKVHERFMLIDGNRVATGSYRFNWTDGKLNSSNLIELSGQITEKFDEEFRILYAQSLPINAKGPPNARINGINEPFLLKHSLISSPHLARKKPAELACLTSTPTRKLQASAFRPPGEPLTPNRCTIKPVSYSSTINENWMKQQQHMQEEILAGSTTQPPVAFSCQAAAQTSWSVTDSETQTDLVTQTIMELTSPRQSTPTRATPDATLKDSFHKLAKERRYHYSVIRAKLEHMVTGLSQRLELADVTNTTQGSVLMLPPVLNVLLLTS